MTAAEPPRGFEDAEFEARTRAVQAAMASAGPDALLLTTEADIRYFSGFLTPFWQSPTRPWFLLVPAAGKPVAVVPEIGARTMRRTWLDDVRTWPSPDPEDDGITLLADTIGEIAGRRPRIGLMCGAETHLRMPLADFRRLGALLGAPDFVDATTLVRRLRMVKSDAEIAKIGHVCRLASDAFDRVPERLRPGMTDADAFRAFRIACLEAGVDEVPYLVGGAGPGGCGDIISPPSGRRIETGDVLILDAGCMWDGYFCDFDRNFAIRSVNAAARDAHAILWDATEAGLAAARPGATFADLHDAMAAAIPGSDGSVGRMGHGLGMQLTEPPSVAPFERTVLQAGMVLTLEPGYEYGDGLMMVHEENIVVRDAGPELLSRRAPRMLPVIG